MNTRQPFWPCGEKKEARSNEKPNRGKERKKTLNALKMWLKVGRVTDALKATTRYRDVWKVMIAYAHCT